MTTYPSRGGRRRCSVLGSVLRPTLGSVLRPTLGLALGVLALAALPAHAWDEHGVTLSLHTYRHVLAGVDAPPEDDPDALVLEEEGRGLVLGVGYTFTPSAHLRMQLLGAGHDTSVADVDAVRLTALLELHYRLAAGSRVRPVLIAGLGATAVAVDEEAYDVTVNGAVASTGLGMLVHLADRWSLELMTRVDLINWNETRVVLDRGDGISETIADPVEEDGAAASFALGVVWQL